MRWTMWVLGLMTTASCKLSFDPTDIDICGVAAQSASAVFRWNDSCYSYHALSNNFGDAEAACESIGAHLVTYTTAAESDAVAAGLPLPGPTWIGLSYHPGYGDWNWVTGEPEPYARWAPGEPASQADGDAAAEHPDGSWYATNANNGAIGFVCETASVITHGHVYVVDDNPAVWDVARATCEARGGHLATLTSADEELLIEPLLGGGGRWIGASDRTTAGAHTWITGEPFDFANWAEYQPGFSYPGQDCVVAATSGWSDRACSEMRGHLCELEQP